MTRARLGRFGGAVLAVAVHMALLLASASAQEPDFRLVELRPGIERLRLVHEGVRSVQLGPHPFSVNPLFAYAPGVGSIVVARFRLEPIP